MAGLSPRSWPRAARIGVFVAAFALLVALAGSAGALVTVRRSFPQTSGTLEVAGLDSPVRVVRDDLGVPRIYADNSPDLFFAQGYVEAQDRFWQMDAWRHLAEGRLAELVGEDALPSDKVMRTLGLRDAAVQELDMLDKDTVAHLEDFSRGVTAYLRTHGQGELSLEYAILDTHGLEYEPESWTPVDSLTWLKAMAWSMDESHETEELHAILSPLLTQKQLALFDAMGNAAGAGDQGSAWVVGADRSTTGAPILADAPKLPVSLPGAWYQVGLHCTTVDADCPYDVAGFTLAGLPGVLVGRNRDVAWGMVGAQVDTSDLFLEKISGHSYLSDGQQMPLTEHDETIEVLGGEPFRYTVRRTAHGPLLSDVDKQWARAGANAAVPNGSPSRGGGYGVAVSTTAALPGKTMDAIFELDRATSWDDFDAAAADVVAPAVDLVFAGRDGRIGTQRAGVFPTRAVTGAGQAPVPGWVSSSNWTGWAPYDSLPRAIGTTDAIVLGGADQPRIEELLSAEEKLSVADMNRIQTDSWNRLGPELTPYLLAIKLHGFDAIGQGLLRSWDFTQDDDSAAAAYFNAVYRHILLSTFGDDLPDGIGIDDDGEWTAMLSAVLADPDSVWWDDRRTKDVFEHRDDVLRQAMLDARDELIRLRDRDPKKWRWGDLHRLDPSNPEFALADSWLGRKLLDRGDFGMAGSGASIGGASWDPRTSYDVSVAPAMRMVVSLSDAQGDRSGDASWVSLTGESGHAFSEHYTDQAKLLSDDRTAQLVFDDEPGRTLRLVPDRTE